ncbi:MAG: DUF2017 family protein [Acidimicrobiales bacterium]
MAFFRRQRLFEPRPDGRFNVQLSPDAKKGIVSLAEELEELQSTDRPETRRLFPTAYPDDPERDAGYQIFARDQLIEKRRAAVEIIRQTSEADVLTADELGSWMGVLNDLRLVLGTMLDVSEDDDDIDFDGPEADSQMLYRYLGELVHSIVEALTTSLPEPAEDADD